MPPSSILFLQKEWFSSDYRLEEEQIKITGEREMGKWATYIKARFKPIFPLFLT
jgi:hypothetical protein